MKVIRYCYLGLVVVLGLVLLLVVHGTDPVEGATLKVGPGETYTEIQDAVDAASSGDTVQVAAGTYDEDIVIDVAIEIHGNTQTNTIINGTRTDNAVTITVSGVEFYKFTIKNSQSGYYRAGIYMVNATNCTISMVTINDLSSNGIYMSTNCSDTTIEDCTIMSNRYRGIYVSQSSFVTIDSNECSENGDEGIYLFYQCDNNTISKNTCDDNGNEGIQLGNRCTGTLIEDNDCQSNEVGISLRDSINCTVKDNTCRSNTFSGIDIIRCSNSIVKDNVCSSSTYTDGIELSSGRDLLVVGNRCNNNGGRGIFVRNTVNATIDDNECKSNGQYGIDLLSSYRDLPMRCTVINNTCTGNTYHGIGVSQDTSYNLVHGNDCSNNGRNGINIDSSHHNTVQNNDCSDNNRYGIELPMGTYYRPTEYNIVANNTIDNNDLDGIFIDSNYHIIRNNTATNNVNGINCLKDHILIEDNTCNSNSAEGILCVKNYYWVFMVNITIRNNTCRLNDHGILFKYMDSCIIEMNKCAGNEYVGIDVGGKYSIIRNNELASNKLNGLNVTGSANTGNTVENNRCYFNLQQGIYLWAQRYLTLRNNSCLINGEDGISIISSRNLTMEDNVLFQNGRYGIWLRSYGLGCTISNNTLARNVRSGIMVERNGYECTISGNLFMEENCGINMTSANDCTIEGNIIYNSTLGIRQNNCYRTLVYNNWFDSVTNTEVVGGGQIKWNISKTAGTNICGFGFLGGNYWSDYDGVDLDGDWIGDTNLPHGPVDYLPLIKETVLPEIDDITVGIPTTGETFEIKVNVTDNHGVGSVYILYWFGFDTPKNVSLEKADGDSWNLTIDIPFDQSTPLKYIIIATDISDNWNRTVQRNVTVVDNDIPTIDVSQMANSTTTGDSFEFMVEVLDNIAIEHVWVEYWYNGTPVTVVDLFDFGTHLWKTTITIDHKVIPMHYIAYVNDTSGNSNMSVSMNVTILDNDAPSITWWSNVNFLETGGTGHFAVKASDNIGVTEVEMEYWFDEGPYQTIVMAEGEPGTWEHEIDVPIDSLDALNYRYHVRDAAGNARSSSVWVVRIRDLIGPTILADDSESFAVAGGQFEFLLSASDNIALRGAWVRYQFGDGKATNSSMDMIGPGDFKLNINVPQALDPLNYTFSVKDTAGSWAIAEMRSVPIIDLVAPLWIRDTSRAEATTGDPFFFSIDVSDAVGVTEVWVEYDNTGDEIVNSSAEQMTEITWQLWVEILSDARRTMTYQFLASDAYGNWATTTIKEITVLDDDPPELGPVRLEPIWRYSQENEILVDVSDNKHVWNVWALIIVPSGREENHGMDLLEGETWSLSLSFEDVGKYEITVWATDTEGNRNFVVGPYFNVRDTLPPVLGSIVITPAAPKVGEAVNLSVEVTDDVIVSRVWLELVTPGGETSNESMIDQGDGTWFRNRALSEHGNYSYTVIAEDGDGNTKTSETGTFEVKKI
ncbi:MAG: right-handed parallel beta-helix repeat-containing protein, partial [Thermoplasmata archaeon]|nr:right-handed parallel beta-helix repeat-containing protein [Thermoplasmata archaeon]